MNGGNGGNKLKVIQGPQDPKSRSLSVYQMAIQKQQPSAAPDFQQQFPTHEYLSTKRQSVFQKINLTDLNQIKLQEIPKTEEQL
jgi:hypothetical protein